MTHGQQERPESGGTSSDAAADDGTAPGDATTGLGNAATGSGNAATGAGAAASRPGDATTESGEDGAAAEAGNAKPRAAWLATLTSDDRFQAANALTPAALLDAGLPLALFTVVYTAGGRDLTMSLWFALGAGVLLALFRLIRREQMQNVIAGFLGLGIAVFVASRTGRAEDVFLPGLLINVAYGLAYLVSIIVRWPLLGVLVGLATGQGMGWRRDPAMLRAYTLASALWIGMFALRLAVQAPLYFAGEDQLGWLAGTRLMMSWPLFLLVAYLSWLIIRPAYRAYQERTQQETPPQEARGPVGETGPS